MTTKRSVCRGGILVFGLLAGASYAQAAQKKAAKSKQPAINKDDGVTYVDAPFKMRYAAIPQRLLPLITPGWKGEDGYGQIKRTARDQPYALRVPITSTKSYKLRWNGKKSYGQFDVNGDGQFKGKLEHPNINRAGNLGPLTFLAVYSDGSRAPYALCVVKNTDDSRTLKFFRACYRKGTLKVTIDGGRKRTVKLELYDDNNNGLFDDYGLDSMKVDGKWLFVSPLVMLHGGLYHMRVSPSGTRVFLKPYDGSTGKVDVASGFKVKGGLRLDSVIIKAGAKSFDVAPPKRGTKVMRIPTGSYTIAGGVLRKGPAKLRILEGTLKPFEVAESGTVRVEWGAPFHLRAKIASDVRGIVVQDAGIYGTAGVYFVADGEPPPAVTIRLNSRTGRVIHKAMMSYGKDGKLEPWFWNPATSAAGLQKGVFYIQIAQKTRSLGRLKSEPVRLAYKSLF